MDNLIGNENVNQQQCNDELDDQGYLRPRAAVNNRGGAGGIDGVTDGNANANPGIGEMGLNNLKVLRGTEGSEGIRRSESKR
ncbi:hypothetical protein AAVH_05948 [Aphelenchoides avenae]|nr:hypothetical protein AAVH_05948 [Aphelenchus avenae]